MTLPAERRQQIADIVRERHSISCGELCEQFNVSPGTVRKDLEMLEKKGCLKREYGGAINAEYMPEKVLRASEREVIHAEIKDRLGAYAAQQVCDGDTVFIDASTTSLFVAKHIKERKGITVITNAERVINELRDCEEIRVICTGGVLRKGNMSYVGETAEKLIQTGFFADKMFFSCCGVSKEFGVFDSVEAEANIKRAMFASSREVILLCDASKFGRLGFPKLAGFDVIHSLITEKQLSDEWRQQLDSHAIKVQIVD